MNYKIITLVVTALTFLGTSCDKENPEDADNQPQVMYMFVNIDSPTEGATYNFNDEVSINGNIEANFEAHGYIVRFWNTSNDDSLLFETDGHEHGDNIPINASWTNNLTDTSNVRIEVTAYSDHQGSYTEKRELNVVCYPQ